MKASPPLRSHVPLPGISQSEEELYEMAPCGYVTTGHDGHIVRVNRTLLDWLGYQASELLGVRRFVDLLTVGGRMFYETHFNLLLRMQSAVDEIALDLVCKDGRVLPALINARQKRTSEGEPVLNRFTVFNSTERRMYERQLLAARDLLQTTLASIGDGVIVTDQSGVITFVNPVAGRLTGWHEDAAFGKSVEDVLVLRNEASGEEVETPVRCTLQKGSVVGLEEGTVLVARDGSEIPIDDSAAPIRDRDGQVVGAVMVFRDISAQRAQERALRTAHDALQRTAADLRRSNEDLSQFAHVASHDLRSPLNTIMGFAQLIEERHGSQLGEGGNLLHHLRDAASRMARLMDDMLSYAQASAGTSDKTILGDAGKAVDEALRNLELVIQKAGALVTAGELPVVPVSSVELLQLFQNLIGNAIHYRGPVAPQIRIWAEAREESWLFACRDNGIGIAASYHAKVFEAFKRLHGPERPGSGVGLAVCKKIVERAGGSIWVESEEGQGSTFFFTIPRSG